MKEVAMKTPLDKEFDRLRRNEEKFLSKRDVKQQTRIEKFVSDKIPAKLESTLKKAFSKAFHLIFSKGTPLIEKTYSQDKVAERFAQDSAMLSEQGRRIDLMRFNYRAAGSGIMHTFVSTAAGTAMGLIGVGIPDVAVFTSLMLRNIYSIAMRYGYEYSSEDEQKFVLRIIAASLQWGEELRRSDRWINAYIAHGLDLDDHSVEDLIEQASDALACDLLIMKFIQGKPIIGVIGGASDFVFMEKISDYAELKYRRRFLTDLEREETLGHR